MDEKQLTAKQREWLALSKKIGPGPMTKSERQALEKLFKEMLPKEQQDLYEHIQEVFGQKSSGEGEADEPRDPVSIMERRTWTPPSDGLKAALEKFQATKPLGTRKGS